MEIKLCQSKNEWDDFLLKHDQNEFLQSFDWGEFQGKVGKKPIRMQLVENGQVIWQGQGFEHRLVLGWKYLYLPRAMGLCEGERGKGKGERVEEKMLNLLLDFFKKQKYIFTRFEFVSNINNLQSPAFATATADKSIFNLHEVKNRQPHYTLVLNLTQSAEEILSNMHSKTRYNINLAEKKGVLVKWEKNEEAFFKLNEETKQRDGFRSYGREYYQKMLAQDNVYQVIAYCENKPIASNICVRFGEVFTYLHGASSNYERNLMAPYLLQWQGIKKAQELGCKYYDFWGIAPTVAENDQKIKTCFNNICWETNHPWTGITRFKAGFGGMTKEYPVGVEVPIRLMIYKIFMLVKKLL